MTKIDRIVEEDQLGAELFSLDLYSTADSGVRSYYFASEDELSDCFDFLQRLHKQQNETV